MSTPAVPGTAIILEGTGAPGADGSPTPGAEPNPAGGDASNGSPPAGGAGKDPPKDAKTNEEIEALVLDLGRRGRVLQTKEKGLQLREHGLKQKEGRLQLFDRLTGLANTDPAKFLVEIADAVGLTAERAAEIIVQIKGGGTPSITADERVTRLEGELREWKQKAADAEKAANERQTETANEEAINGHISDITSIIKGKPTDFPISSDEDEIASAAREAFDLMVMFHDAAKNGRTNAKGQPIRAISHEEAARLVESNLAERSAKRAQKLGYAKVNTETLPSPTDDLRVTPTPTPNASRSNGAAAAPSVASAIKSDEDIAADFLRGFARH